MSGDWPGAGGSRREARDAPSEHQRVVLVRNSAASAPVSPKHKVSY